jgi:anti-anti-sigma factor
MDSRTVSATNDKAQSLKMITVTQLSAADGTGGVSVRLFAVKGDMDLTAAPQIRQALDRALAEEDDRRLVLDLRPTEYLDSVGLALLVRFCEREKARHPSWSPAVVVTPRSQPERILNLSHFDRLLQVGHSVEQALGQRE